MNNVFETKICIECSSEILNSGVKFCSRSCSAAYNNKLRISKKSETSCLCCQKSLRNISGSKFCSIKCAKDHQYQLWIEEWKKGNKNGSKGKSLTVANALRKFLFIKYDFSCSICSWNEKNPATGLSPLEVHHIDGDALNNSEENLTLLCPNCHSLTLNYKSLNSKSSRKR